MSRRQTRVSLDSVRVLDAIERRGSFAAAAQELCVVTSSVTHAVRNLEEDLGLTLFDRSGRRARFTSEGRQVLERGRRLLAEAEGFSDAVRRIATGWEPRLVLCVDQVLRLAPLMPLVGAFFRAAPQTSLALCREAAAGTWDALLSGRADLVVGAPAQGPAGGGYATAPLRGPRFVLCVAPGHPLAARDGPIADEELLRHRAVVVSDTARGLPHLQYGLTQHRATLAVPDTEAKVLAILAGLGCGFVPERLARQHARAGRLVVLRAGSTHPPGESVLAWRAGENGRALRWWIEQLSRPRLAPQLFF
ncbi:MAG: LysR family transcriptional regulator [Burkholderiales bacterium]|nr:LysR family transcriptional regulator [Burkholderiales bacterium]